MDDTVVTSTTVSREQQLDDDADALLEMARQRIAEYRREGRFVTRISDDEDYKKMVRDARDIVTVCVTLTFAATALTVANFIIS
tara:strand:- start:202 stop:453 length:252 start_codon:yes stop_codon:yes gene_type:complete